MLSYAYIIEIDWGGKMDNNDYREEQQDSQQNSQQGGQQDSQQNSQQGEQQYSQQSNQQSGQQGNQQGYQYRQNYYGQYPPPPPFKQQYYYYPNNKPPYNYQQQYYYNQPNLQSSKNYAIASLVMGIISIITCAAIVFPAILGALALVFSNKSKKEIPIGYPGRHIAEAGFVLSIIGLSLVALVLFSEVTSFLSECFWHF